MQTVGRQCFLPVRQAPWVGARVFFCEPPPPPASTRFPLGGGWFLDPAAQRLRVIVAVPGILVSPRRGLVGLAGVPAPSLRYGHSAFAVRPDPVVDRSNARAEPFGGLLLLLPALHLPGLAMAKLMLPIRA